MSINMNEYKNIIGNKIALLVLRFLWTKASGVTGRAIASAVGFSPQAVLNILKILEDTQLVRSKDVGRAKWYEINREHWFVSDGLVPLWNKIDDWMNILGVFYIDHLKTQPRTIVVFGSFAKGAAKKGSDLDILFIYNDEKFSPDNLDEVTAFDSMVFNRFGVNPSPKVYSMTGFIKDVKKGEGLARNIFREGKSIAGINLSEVMLYGSKNNKDLKC